MLVLQMWAPKIGQTEGTSEPAKPVDVDELIDKNLDTDLKVFAQLT